MMHGILMLFCFCMVMFSTVRAWMMCSCRMRMCSASSSVCGSVSHRWLCECTPHAEPTACVLCICIYTDSLPMPVEQAWCTGRWWVRSSPRTRFCFPLPFSCPMPNHDIFQTQEQVCLSAIEENSQLDIFQCSDQCEYLVTSIPIAFEGRVKVRVNPAVAHAERCIEAKCWREKDALNTVRVEACDAGDHGWFWLRAFRH